MTMTITRITAATTMPTIGPIREDSVLVSEPPLNLMSFVISVKFRLISEFQILSISGMINLDIGLENVIVFNGYIFLHGPIFLPLEVEVEEWLAEVQVPHGVRPDWSSELAPDEVILAVNIRPCEAEGGPVEERRTKLVLHQVMPKSYVLPCKFRLQTTAGICRSGPTLFIASCQVHVLQVLLVVTKPNGNEFLKKRLE